MKQAGGRGGRDALELSPEDRCLVLTLVAQGLLDEREASRAETLLVRGEGAHSTLVGRGLLSPAQLSSVTGALPRIPFSCTACGQPWSFDELRRERRDGCPACGGRLEAIVVAGATVPVEPAPRRHPGWDVAPELAPPSPPPAAPPPGPRPRVGRWLLVGGITAALLAAALLVGLGVRARLRRAERIEEELAQVEAAAACRDASSLSLAQAALQRALAWAPGDAVVQGRVRERERALVRGACERAASGRDLPGFQASLELLDAAAPLLRDEAPLQEAWASSRRRVASFALERALQALQQPTPDLSLTESLVELAGKAAPDFRRTERETTRNRLRGWRRLEALRDPGSAPAEAYQAGIERRDQLLQEVRALPDVGLLAAVRTERLEFQLSRGRCQEVTQAYRKAGTEGGIDATMALLDAHAHLGAGRWERALNVLGELAGLPNGAWLAQLAGAERIILFHVFGREDAPGLARLLEAVSTVEAACEQVPEVARLARPLLGAGQAAMADRTSALKTWAEAEARCPEDAQLQWVRGLSLAHVREVHGWGDPELLVLEQTSWERFLAASEGGDPSPRGYAAQELGRLRLAARDPGQARGYLEQAVAAFPDQPEPRFLLGLCRLLAREEAGRDELRLAGGLLPDEDEQRGGELSLRRLVGRLPPPLQDPGLAQAAAPPPSEPLPSGSWGRALLAARLGVDSGTLARMVTDLLAQEGGGPDEWLAMARLAVGRDLRRLAGETLRRAREAGAPPAALEPLLAERALRAGELAAARGRLQALADGPDPEAAACARAELALLDNRLSDARLALDPLLEREPTCARALILRSLARAPFDPPGAALDAAAARALQGDLDARGAEALILSRIEAIGQGTRGVLGRVTLVHLSSLVEGVHPLGAVAARLLRLATAQWAQRGKRASTGSPLVMLVREVVDDLRQREPDRGDVHLLLGHLELLEGQPRERVLEVWRRGRALAPDCELDPSALQAWRRGFPDAGDPSLLVESPR